MSDNNISLRHPVSIDSTNELEVAKRKAEINASQDRLLLANNLSELRSEGPGVLVRNIVLPVLGVGVAIYGVKKLVDLLSDSDERSYYVEPDDDLSPEQSRAASLRRREQLSAAESSDTAFQQNSRSTSSASSSALSLAKYLPVVIQLSKMAVGYMEKNGKYVPKIIHDILAPPGSDSYRESVSPAADTSNFSTI